MTKDNRSKILKALISFIITFLVVFITVVVLRALTLNINVGDNKAHAFLKDYFDVMYKKTEVIASKFKIRNDNVSEYQRNLISQSVNDYASLLKYQTYEISKDFNPTQKLAPSTVDSYKEKFYKMILENPYIMSITFFNDAGQMKLNMFSVKGITIELSEELREKTRSQGSIFLHAENENALYTIMYMQNEHGSFYVATRNDYVFVSDMIAYYQIPENAFMITDSYNVTQRIEQNDIALMSEAAKENISSIIGRYAYYKQEPAFSIDAQSNLMVSMVSKNYPNYFELLLISFTALMIVIAQHVIMLIIGAFKKAFPMGILRKEDIEDRKAASIINKSILKDEQQLAFEGLSLENVLEYNRNMKDEASDLDTDKSALEEAKASLHTEEEIRPFSSFGSSDILDKEPVVESSIEEKITVNYGQDDELKLSQPYQSEELGETENLDNHEEVQVAENPSDGSSMLDVLNEQEYSYSSISSHDNNEETLNDEINADIMPKKEVKKYNNRSVDDIFASFDNLLESIISKADQGNVVSKD